MHCGYCNYRHSTCERREDKKRIWKTGLHTRMQVKTHRKKNGEGYLSSTQFSPPPPLGSFGGRQALKTRACSGSLKSRFQVKDPEKCGGHWLVAASEKKIYLVFSRNSGKYQQKTHLRVSFLSFLLCGEAQTMELSMLLLLLFLGQFSISIYFFEIEQILWNNICRY